MYLLHKSSSKNTPVKGQLGIKEECECNDLYLFPLPRY